jgi:hypothetical protein
MPNDGILSTACPKRFPAVGVPDLHNTIGSAEVVAKDHELECHRRAASDRVLRPPVFESVPVSLKDGWVSMRRCPIVGRDDEPGNVQGPFL